MPARNTPGQTEEKSYRVTPDRLILDKFPTETKPNSKRKIYVYLRPVDPQEVSDHQAAPNVSENNHIQGTEQEFEEPDQSPKHQFDGKNENEQKLNNKTIRGSPKTLNKTLNNRMHSILEFPNFN